MTGNEYVGIGQPVLLGAATVQVTSMAAVLPDGRSFPGVVKTGCGLPVKAWTVSYPQARGVRLVFRDASGRQVASLGTAAPLGPPQVAQPRSGGLLVLRFPFGRAGTRTDTMTAYLLQGRVGFWSMTWGGFISPVPAAGGPLVGGLILPSGVPVVHKGRPSKQSRCGARTGPRGARRDPGPHLTAHHGLRASRAAVRPASRAARSSAPPVARRLTTGESGAGRIESTAGARAEAGLPDGPELADGTWPAGRTGLASGAGLAGEAELAGGAGLAGAMRDADSY